MSGASRARFPGRGGREEPEQEAVEDRPRPGDGAGGASRALLEPGRRDDRALSPAAVAQHQLPQLRHVSGAEGQPSPGVREAVVGGTEPLLAPDPEGLEQSRPGEVGRVHLGPRSQNAGEDDDAAAVVLPARPRVLAHGVLEDEANPIAPRVVEALQVGAGVGVLAPEEPRAHGQEMPEGERVLAGIPAAQVGVFGKRVQDALVLREEEPLVDRDPHEQGGHALGHGLHGMTRPPGRSPRSTPRSPAARDERREDRGCGRRRRSAIR